MCSALALNTRKHDNEEEQREKEEKSIYLFIKRTWIFVTKIADLGEEKTLQAKSEQFLKANDEI
jgi:hypothetical protein